MASFKTKMGLEIEYYERGEFKGVYKYWKQARPGDLWLLSDDGYVVKARQVKELVEVRGKSSRTRYRVWFQMGKRYTHGRSVYNFMEHVAKKDTIGYSPRTWWEALASANPHLVKMLARLVISKRLNMNKTRKYSRMEYGYFDKVALAFYGEVSDQKNWYKIRTFYNHEGVRMLIQDEIDKMLKEFDITAQKTMELYQKAERAAVASGNGKLMLAVAQEYRDLLGINLRRAGAQSKSLPPGTSDAPDERLLEAINNAPERKEIQDATIVES